jgi:hypothetical protein
MDDLRPEQEAPQRNFERPLAEGLVAIAEAAQHGAMPVSRAYTTFRRWTREKQLCGHSPDSSFPNWHSGIYISTSLTSGGAALRPGITSAEAVTENTTITSALTTELIRDNGVEARDILLASDLPYVKGWQQSDFMLFWLPNLAGLPADPDLAGILDELAVSPHARAMNDSTLSHEERWPHYEGLVDDFDGLCRDLRVYGRNDYFNQQARPGTMIQLIDAKTSLGCRAEEYYAELRGIDTRQIIVQPELLTNKWLVGSLGELAGLGAQVGLPRRGVQVV